MQGTVLSDVWQNKKPQTPAFASGMGATNPSTPAFADAMGNTAAAGRGVSNLNVKVPKPVEQPATPGAPAGGTAPAAPGAPSQPQMDPARQAKVQREVERIQREIVRMQGGLREYIARYGNDPANAGNIADLQTRVEMVIMEAQQRIARLQAGDTTVGMGGTIGFAI